MSNLIDSLNERGCDTAGALERFLDDEDLYAQFYLRCLDDKYFVMLGQALLDGDIDNAFDYAHALKGVIGNMGITPLFNLTCEIVEILRAKTKAGVVERYNRLMKMRNEYKSLLNY